jgi:hypothetical protein
VPLQLASTFVQSDSSTHVATARRVSEMAPAPGEGAQKVRQCPTRTLTAPAASTTRKRHGAMEFEGCYTGTPLSPTRSSGDVVVVQVTR